MNRLGGIGRSLTQCFLAGVFAVLPLVITVAIVAWVAATLRGFIGPDALFGRLLKQLGLQFASNTMMAYVFGWVVVLAGIFVLGVLVQIGAKRIFLNKLDALAQNIPLLGGVYGTARQVVGMMNKKGGTDLQGMRVVFCFFGKENGAALLGLLPTPQLFRVKGVDYHAVLIPTSPVPVGGGLIFVPVDCIQPADVSVDAFMSIYVSMGVSAPQFLSGLSDRPTAPAG
jgi:uncharacterized membrane protein